MMTQDDPNSLVPYTEVATLMTVARLPDRFLAWGQAMPQRLRDRRALPEITFALQETAYLFWCALKLEQVPFYTLDSRTHTFVSGLPPALRRLASWLVEQYRFCGLHALADWAESQRRFDLEFFQRLEIEEREAGYPIDLLLGQLHLRRGDMDHWLGPQLHEVDRWCDANPEQVQAFLALRFDRDVPAEPSPCTPDSSRETDATIEPEHRKDLYGRVRQIYERAPDLTPSELLPRLKPFGIRRENDYVVWRRPDDGHVEKVAWDTFCRRVRTIRQEVAASRT